MRIAFGDLPGIESIQTLAAIERAKERGVNVELIILNDEDLAAQAIVGGQADVGIGAPYTLIQKVGVPIRMFAQISTLRFFPVVNGEFYKDWKDLDGQEIAVQARGSGTEAVMLLMAKNHGITYRQHQLRAGLRSAPQRAAAGHDQGLDRRRRQPPRARGRGAGQVHRAAGRGPQGHRRRRCSPPPTISPSDAADVDILVEELINTGARDHRQPGRRRRISATNTSCCPTSARKPMPRSRPTTRRPPRPAACRSTAAAPMPRPTISPSSRLAGQIEGDPATLKVEDFWDVAPLDRAVAKLGKK